ncbi:MAG TPA: hypothetical protein VFA60_11370 [Terriglobales bacterium]|nr:hypothetical protein [Terriglobales bacterium]
MEQCLDAIKRIAINNRRKPSLNVDIPLRHDDPAGVDRLAQKGVEGLRRELMAALGLETELIELPSDLLLRVDTR